MSGPYTDADGAQTIILWQSPAGCGEPCASCGKPCEGGYGLPVYNGDVVSNDWPFEWGGVNACVACYDLHQRGMLATYDHHYMHLYRLFRDGGGI